MFKFSAALPVGSLLLAFAFPWGCRKEMAKSHVTNEIVNPVDIALAPDGAHFLLLSANWRHELEGGNIMAVKAATGEKVGYTKVPRLGRSLKVKGNYLIATFDQESANVATTPESRVQVYQLSTQDGVPTLTLAKEWLLSDCVPINSTIGDGDTPYAVVSCTGGRVYAGKLDGTNSTLQHVRTYTAIARHALVIMGNYAFGFPTQMGGGVSAEYSSFMDKRRWNGEKGSYEDKQDDVPDVLAKNKTNIRYLERVGHSSQMFILDLAATEAESYKLRTLVSDRPQVQSELRLVNYDLAGIDGTPDFFKTQQKVEDGIYKKGYWGNYWQAQLAQDGRSFFLSQGGERYNNIVKMSLLSDPKATLNSSGTYDIKPFSSIFHAERIYGYRGEETTAKAYYRNFKVMDVDGRQTVVVNCFRDPAYFKSPYFSLKVADIEDTSWNSELSSTSMDRSFYNFEVTDSQELGVISFYNNELILYRLRSGREPEEIKVIS